MSKSPEHREHIWCDSCYFRDGKSKIDFVIVSTVIKSRADMTKLSIFLEYLVQQGLQLENSRGVYNQGHIFIKIHATEKKLRELAEKYDIALQCDSSHYYSGFRKSGCPMFNNIATIPNENHPVYQRAVFTLAGHKPRKITSAERALIINKVLWRAPFSDNEHDRGHLKLVKSGIVVAAYPLHDSDSQWPLSGPISDRQLLMKYWASMWCIFKVQPLNIIRKYFGPEVAFYFAFMDFYLKMLVPASVIGLAVFIYNVITSFVHDTARFKEICNSDLILCPACLEANICKFSYLKSFCQHAKISSIFDNYTSVVYAAIMSLWSTIATEMWKRRENELRYHWNLMNVESSTATRYDYWRHTKYRRTSKYTGEIEPYVPVSMEVLTKCITAVFCMLMTFVVVLAILCSMLLRQWVLTLLRLSKNNTLQSNATLISMSLSSIISFTFMRLFSPAYMSIARYLTNIENPRTILEYHNSIIYKAYVLAFVNSYFPIFYLAFVKGNLYMYPGYSQEYNLINGLFLEQCQPSGCILSLTFLLLFILVLKVVIIRLIIWTIAGLKKCLKKTHTFGNQVPLWERELYLRKYNEFSLNSEYMEVVVQYGFITFFVASLPVAPALGLLSNIFELRWDAMKLLRDTRRPISRRLPGIGAWNIIFRCATYIGTVTNAFVIAFTSDIMARELYRYKKGSLSGFVNTTLSEFNTNDYIYKIDEMTKDFGDVPVCVYKGMRNPYYADDKYKLSDNCWEQLSFKMGFVVIFEQVIWILTGICAAVITDMPDNIRQDMYDEQIKVKAMRYEIINSTIEAEHVRRRQQQPQNLRFNIE